MTNARPAAPGDADVVATKSTLRREMRRRRDDVVRDAEGRSRRSEAMWSRLGPLIGLALESAPRRDPVVMLFDSLPGEPDTTTWRIGVRELGAGVAVPAVDGPDLVVVDADDPARPLDPARLVAVVVPALAFDAAGRRLGQGGGHYDRFLAALDGDVWTIGVCFEELVLDRVPTDRHDIAVDRVVTG